MQGVKSYLIPKSRLKMEALSPTPHYILTSRMPAFYQRNISVTFQNLKISQCYPKKLIKHLDTDIGCKDILLKILHKALERSQPSNSLDCGQPSTSLDR